MSEYCLTQDGENKLHFDEMMMSALY